MRNRILLGSFLALAVASTVAAQTTCGGGSTTLASNANLQGLMRTPAHYEGDITSGTLAPGTWRLDVVDTGWPASGSSRRNHIKSLYVYDAAARVFRLTFEAPQASFTLATPAGTFAGTAVVTLTASDANNNRVLNNNELNSQTITATLSATCGMGTAACGGQVPLSGIGSLDTVTAPLSGAATLQPCVTAIEPSAWTAVKSLYSR